MFSSIFYNFYNISGKISDMTGSYDAAFLFAGSLVFVTTVAIQVVNVYTSYRNKTADAQKDKPKIAV